jgi:hypothetical protein
VHFPSAFQTKVLCAGHVSLFRMLLHPSYHHPSSIRREITKVSKFSLCSFLQSFVYFLPGSSSAISFIRPHIYIIFLRVR